MTRFFRSLLRVGSSCASFSQARAARLVAVLAVVTAASGMTAAASAQDAAVIDPPAHVSIVEGTVVLERDGRTDTAPASMPLLAGDRLRTAAGRAEVLFADGSTLHLDGHTLIDFQSDEVVRLLEGRVRLNIAGRSRDLSYRIDAPAAWVEIEEPGEYRVSLVGRDREAELELAVIRGAAELVNEDGRTLLRAGERAFARAGLAPSSAYVFNSAAWDDFDRWSEARRAERLGAYAEYLPEEVRPYSTTFVNYGSWRHEPTYGYVWYPTVRVGWRPYYYGRWSRLRPWGWTWIGTDPWAWPTHHYGRWGFSAGLWFWIPGRHWSPAWVSWAYAPGYVSWCPLGWNNRPVIGFINVNVYGRRHYDHWNAWTVVPRQRFGSGFVHVNVINTTRLDVRTRNAFVVRNSSPVVTGHAVPRSEAPIRTAGRRGTSALTGSRAPGVAAPGGVAADSGAGFRSRRSAGEPLTGPGLPSPAREPRNPSAIRTPAQADRAPARARAVPVAPSGDPGRVDRRAQPRYSPPVSPGQPVTPGDSDRVERRARPRYSPPVSPGQTEVYRGTTPSYRGVPVTPPRSEAPDARPNRAPQGYAVPRGGEGRYRAEPPAASQPDYGRRVPPGGGYRAVPRSAPDSGGAPPSYRAPSAGERRAPVGPTPPSAAPAPSNRGGGSRAGESRGGDARGGETRGGGAARPRGGAPSSGRAVRRGGER